MNRKCSSCDEYKELTEFSPDARGRDGYHSYCKSCNNIRNRNRYNKNKDIIRVKHKEWREKNPHYMKEYRNKNIEQIRNNAKIKAKKNRDKTKAWYLEYRKRNPIFRIRCGITSRLWTILNKKTSKKPCKLKEALGCSVSDLKIYLESKFTEGMSWDNYGKWHVDHIMPLSSFNLTIESEFKKANHYTNLQPLWALDNLIKGGKIYG